MKNKPQIRIIRMVQVMWIQIIKDLKHNLIFILAKVKINNLSQWMVTVPQIYQVLNNRWSMIWWLVEEAIKVDAIQKLKKKISRLNRPQITWHFWNLTEIMHKPLHASKRMERKR
jgi:hypothetical protein